MAAKLKCPKCRDILKEVGDNTKEAQGSYRVYSSLSNSKEEAGLFRIVECNNCGFIDNIYIWEDAQ